MKTSPKPMDPDIVKSAWEDYIKPRLVIRENGCWEWTEKSKTEAGYGLYRKNQKSYLVHRISLQVKLGVPLGDKLACHTCDNPKCANPDHIRLGTHKDNMQDCITKGRFRGGRTPGPEKPEHIRIPDSTIEGLIDNQEHMPKEQFQVWLKRRRLELGLTQNKMAAILDMGRSKYLDMEYGIRGPEYAEKYGLIPLIRAMVSKAKVPPLPPKTPPSSKVSSPKKKTP